MRIPDFNLPRAAGILRLRAGGGFRSGLRRGVLTLVVGFGLAGTATAQDLFGFGGGNADQAQRRQAELNLRIQQLEGQIRGLNGQVEQLTFQVRQLQDGMTRMQKDIEFRLQELENGAAQPRRPQPAQKRTDLAPPADEEGSGPPRPLAAPMVAGAAPMPPAGIGGSVPRPGPGAPPQVIGQLPASADPIGGVIGGQGPLDLSGGRGGPGFVPAGQAAIVEDGVPPGVRLGPTPPGAPAARSSAAVAGVPPRLRDVPPVASPSDEYDAAYGYILNGEYELAETSFRTFLANHPTDRRVGNAQYWLGESFFARNMNREAADAFLKSYTQYPDGPKASDSLLKLGLALQGLGERKAACATYDELLAKYPKSSKQLRDRAQAEKIRAKC